jgi:glyoxylase-like metal-dependent hydrolase (beta-lactamase superfamily II)
MAETFYRITAPNPGFMTGNGTNTYMIRSANGDCVVIDPGPRIEQHLNNIIATAGDASKIKAIFVTHMHPDHSPLAMDLATVSGARLYSAATLQDDFQDKSFIPDIIVQHDQVVETDGIRIRCIYTPGHVDNHFCFLYENQQILMTGDHMMQGSTVVIIPPQGNMKKYIASLNLLKQYPISKLAPGHGDYIDKPYQEVDSIVQHRLQREQKVLERLAHYSQVSLQDLTKDVYDDVGEHLHVMASFSLLAHLLKLQEEGVTEEQNAMWSIKQ